MQAASSGFPTEGFFPGVVEVYWFWGLRYNSYVKIYRDV